MEEERPPLDLRILFRLEPVDHTLADIAPGSDIVRVNRQFDLHCALFPDSQASWLKLELELWPLAGNAPSMIHDSGQ